MFPSLERHFFQGKPRRLVSEALTVRQLDYGLSSAGCGKGNVSLAMGQVRLLDGTWCSSSLQVLCQESPGWGWASRGEGTFPISTVISEGWEACSAPRFQALHRQQGWTLWQKNNLLLNVPFKTFCLCLNITAVHKICSYISSQLIKKIWVCWS